MKKIIGTAAPLGALWSRTAELKAESGTTAAGERFIGWLVATGQRAWQLLPLAETHLEPGSKRKHVPSPYRGYGIGFSPDYLPTELAKRQPTALELKPFLEENRAWVYDYALFGALRDHFGTDNWPKWEPGARDRRPAALAEWAEQLDREYAEQIAVQWRLNLAFADLRSRAAAAGIELIGDLPFYLPLASPLVWAHRDSFVLARRGLTETVSGVPGGPQDHYGRQVWGHPLYRWKNRKSVMGLWRLRLKFYSRFYDLMRLDHAQGFFSFGAMHVRDRRRDAIRLGPGPEALREIVRYSRDLDLQLCAEDAGDRLEALRRTLRRLKVPGIRMLRYAYDEKRRRIEEIYAAVADYPVNCIAYSSTHDTETLAGYLKLLTPKERRRLAAAVGVEPTVEIDRLRLDLLGALVESPAERVIIQLQDWLGSERRINVPGTEKAVGDVNWHYRAEAAVEDLPSRPHWSRLKRRAS